MEYANFPGCALFNEHQLPAGPFKRSVNMTEKREEKADLHLPWVYVVMTPEIFFFWSGMMQAKL